MNVDLRLVLAIAAAVPGLWLGLRAIAAFRRSGTHVEPWKPTTALVTEGIYAFVRNPMYLGLGLGILTIALALASDWMILMLVPFALVMHFGVVLREERYLEARFGDDYRRYRERVPRYGWGGAAAPARGTTGSLVRPPVVALATILIGLLFDELVPIGLVAEIPEPLRFALTLLGAFLAAALSISAVIAFRRADVSVGPGTPPRLVTDGVFAHTRHPMYLGILLGLLALALSFGSDWMLVFLIPAALTFHRRFTLGEERALEAAFGDEYLRYAARVPRYAWRF
jgi:protein-S-isoprenylcysteine O-methyltransferase Ste14